jgi:hypothetical protein
MKGKPTPAEAKALWDSLEEPSVRKVADRFTAAGRPVDFMTIWHWKQKGWASASTAGITRAAARAVAKIDRAAPALTGDARTTTADIVAARAAKKKAPPPDTRSNAQRAEDALHEALTDATAVWASIRDTVTAKPKRAGAARKNAPPRRLLAAPEGVAKLMMAASAAINMAIEGYSQIPALQAHEAAAVPGTQTVYPPGQGPYAESSHADGFQGEREYPSRSAIESIEQALKKFREGKT